MPVSRLTYLFERYVNGQSTDWEYIKLSHYILAPEHTAALEEQETTPFIFPVGYLH